MNSTIHIHPRITRSWAEFQAEAPANSLALDGYVSGPPVFNTKLRIGNLNHHENVDRLSTNCTAAQAFMLLKQGLLNICEKPLQLFVNDCDQDVCLATWILNHPDRVTGHSSEPLLNRLLWITNALDVCAGAYPIKIKSELMETTIWIYEPYTAARVAGLLPKMDAAGMHTIIEAVHHRIDLYMLGRSRGKLADTRHNIVRDGEMPVIVEHGNEARTALLNLGIHQFISYRGEADGHHYSLIKLTPFAQCDLVESYKLLNELEKARGNDRISPNNCWGGGDTCGGSPRESGSVLSPDEVFNALNPHGHGSSH